MQQQHTVQTEVKLSESQQFPWERKREGGRVEEREGGREEERERVGDPQQSGSQGTQ